LLRSIGPLPYLPVSEARTARPAGTFASFSPQQRSAADAATIVPPRARPFRSLPFLAQYLAQEVIAPDDATPRWAERDSAYRTASGADTSPASISLDA
jgi:hypothetical protein